MIQGQYRSATLQVPAEVTPLKFRGYLRKEIEAVQATAQGEEDIIVVRLFVGSARTFCASNWKACYGL